MLPSLAYPSDQTGWFQIRVDDEQRVSVHAGRAAEATATITFSEPTFYDIAAKRRTWPKPGETRGVQATGNRKLVPVLRSAIEQIR
jgi:hypothetical protein